MAQTVFEVAELPESGIEASAAFHARPLDDARAALDDDGVDALAIVLPTAGDDHDDWRRALARDLARAYTPKRVNVVSGPAGPARQTLLAYLEGAPGVTGQYHRAHD
ncbi:MAG: Rossmann fold domain-containing protein [Erythrobacter sp.]